MLRLLGFLYLYKRFGFVRVVTNAALVLSVGFFAFVVFLALVAPSEPRHASRPSASASSFRRSAR